jgi:hypothetical protein
VASERKGGSHVGAQNVLPFKQCIELYLENNIALGEDDRALLKRLLDDDRAGKVWSTIRAHAQQHGGPIGVEAPMDFIITILQLKSAAEKESKANIEIAAIIAETKKLQTEISRKLGKQAKSVPFHKKGKFFEGAAKIWQGCLSPVISPPRVRSDRHGSRARTYFMRDLSALVHDLTGKWLDERVGEITEIAFNTSEIISGDTVRKARSK